jgi:nitrogen fixation protein FixH
VSARLNGDQLVLTFLQDGHAVQPVIERAVFGRATSVTADQTPEFQFDGTAFRATVEAGEGNWNLRISARATDGTLFQQRIVVEPAT